MNDTIRLRTLEECNQRGRRTLSLVDLIEAGTVDLGLAGYLAAVMRRGSSLLVGAVPGGAGKTTVMVALMQFLPDDVAIVSVADDGVLARAAGASCSDTGMTCYLAHEIGDGSYYAYVSYRSVARYFALTRQGHCVATNLHADTLAQTRAALCDRGAVERADLLAVTLKVFLRVDRGTGWQQDRRVYAVYESNGAEDVLVWAHEPDKGFRRVAESVVVTPGDEAAWRAFLAELRDRGVCEAAAVQWAISQRRCSQ